MLIRAKAPLRISFAGGGTDVAPFPAREGGLVLNATINRYAYGTLRPRDDGNLQIQSLDYGLTAEFAANDPLVFDGKLDLAKAAIAKVGGGGDDRGFDLLLHSNAPPGSGLGASSAMMVALIGVLKEFRTLPLTDYELAELAHTVERDELGISGGRQDQYAAAFGGFHKFTFDRGTITVQPLNLDPDFADELARRTVICYTGISRVSSRAIERVMGAYERGDASVSGALRALVDLAEQMAAALQASELRGVARLLGDNWREQQRLDAAMRTAGMAELEGAMTRAGSHGGKAAGAGAGGSMFFVVEDSARAIAAATEAGARVLPCRWASTGVTVERGQ